MITDGLEIGDQMIKEQMRDYLVSNVLLAHWDQDGMAATLQTTF